MTNDCPKRRFDVSVRVVEGEMVVLDRETDLIHQLNQTASFIWNQCDGRRTVREIADHLAGAFDINPDASKEAVITALRQFNELGLLEPARD